MYGYVLQDWITMRGSNNTSPIVQNESDWLGFSSFQDIVFWADVREVTTTGNVTLSFETSPTKDDVLFQQLTGASVVLASGASSVTVKTVLLASQPAIPLSTWVRWKLSNSLNATWDITFRVLCSANRVTMAPARLVGL